MKKEIPSIGKNVEQLQYRLLMKMQFDASTLENCLVVSSKAQHM